MRCNSAKIDQPINYYVKFQSLLRVIRNVHVYVLGKTGPRQRGKDCGLGAGGELKWSCKKNIIFILVKSFAEGGAGFEGKNGIEQNCQIRRPAWMKFYPLALPCNIL